MPAWAETTAAPTGSVGLALGGGGARGLAHIAMLEAFDELGVRPAQIAGTSVGALIGAGYAAGLAARELREHAVAVLGNRIETARRFFADPRLSLFELFDPRLIGTALMDGRALVRLVLPEGVPAEFAGLAIPLKVIATDFYGRCEAVLASGPLEAALAASMALPGLMAPQTIGGRLLIDGGITNPLPFDRLGGAGITVAVDVTGRPMRGTRRAPTGFDLWFRSSMIMQHTIIEAKLACGVAPRILVAPDVDRFRVLEFYRIAEILEAAAPAKEALKRKLDAALSGAPQRTA